MSVDVATDLYTGKITNFPFFLGYIKLLLQFLFQVLLISKMEMSFGELKQFLSCFYRF